MPKKLKNIVSYILLMAAFAVTVNNSFFLHTHRTADGRVIEHSRPFCPAPYSDTEKGHAKSASDEFSFWAVINSMFCSTVLPATLFIQLILALLCGLVPKESSVYTVEIFSNSIPRAPPLSN